MSYMIITCPWCSATYDTGVVGSQIIGSGHACTARQECETPGCTAPGCIQVAEALGPDGHEGVAFSCDPHVGDRVIIGLQPGPRPPA